MADYIGKFKCHIHSLNGRLAEATILERVGDNQYIADYNGVKCAAIFITVVGRYFVDDMYGVIKEDIGRDYSV